MQRIKWCRVRITFWKVECAYSTRNMQSWSNTLKMSSKHSSKTKWSWERKKMKLPILKINTGKMRSRPTILISCYRHIKILLPKMNNLEYRINSCWRTRCRSHMSTIIRTVVTVAATLMEVFAEQQLDQNWKHSKHGFECMRAPFQVISDLANNMYFSKGTYDQQICFKLKLF